MKRKYILLACFALTACFEDEATRKESALIQQLKGGSCVYEVAYTDAEPTCQPHPMMFWEWIDKIFKGSSYHDCIGLAAQCLGIAKSKRAVPDLITMLETSADIETCDGPIPVRYYVIKALGDIGDARAIEPLKRYLVSNPHAVLSSGATGCKAKPDDLKPAQEAIQKIQSAMVN